jgi:uncharacterized protein
VEVCHAARANSFFLRANGRINKCTVGLEHPANQVGWIRADGRMELDAARMAPWVRGLWSGVAEELNCSFQALAQAPGAAVARVSVPGTA